MSVIGFDIGNESCVIAAAKRGGIDVLLNDESKRETPSVVSFGEKQRFLGSAGAASATANPKSTISQVKRLIGRVYKDPVVQEDLKLLPFVTSEGPRGGILIELEYLKQKMKFTPVEILGMLFTHLKQIAEKNLESAVVDCVIGIPSYFTDLQRREYLDAAFIAGLNPLRLMHDCTATALGYGMYKTDLSDSGQTNVVFVDIGHCDTQVTVAAFQEGKMKILSHSFDQNLGGRDFDEVLFTYFATQFKEKQNIDVYSNARASVRLRTSCEKVKKVLSANAEAPLSIDCLIGDQDVRGIITREEFEKLSSDLLKRVTVPCLKALEDSGLTIDKLSTIELVGSGSRIPAITKILTSFFQKEPTRTLNASECVARGCALRCAMLSPTQKVRDYKVKDIFPYSIALPLDELEDKSHQELMIFPKGSPLPCHFLLKHHGKNSFYFQVLYSNKMDVPTGISPIVGRFSIGSSETPASEQANVELKMKLNDHGIVEIKSASLVEEQRHAFLDYFAYPQRMVVDNLAYSDNLDVATTEDELLKAQEKELMLSEQDKKVEQTKDERNTLESFVYDTRSKLLSAYRSFVTDSEKEEITNLLQKTEDRLYEDSDDECEEDYTGKLKYLKKLLDPIERRYNSHNEQKARAEVTKAMQTCIEKYRSGAKLMSPSHKKAELLKECNRAQEWLNRQQTIPRIKEVIVLFEGNCKDIIGSQPKFANHDKSMHPDQRDRPIVSNQRDQPVNSELREQPGKSRQRDQPMDSSQSDQLVDSNESHQHADHRDLPVDLNQRDRPVDSDPRSKLVNSNPRSKPADSNPRSKPTESKQRNKPVDSNERNKPVDPNQMEQAAALDQRNKSVDSMQRNKHVDLKQRNKPPMALNHMKQAVGMDQPDDMELD
uniref:heat shock 70 kDa protein 16-like n=1 Tax=Erigeron canadensis TaxID=72917 RepID=UPI001CB9A591|nr:heat shock 70 kDa protein 16-like [Erigeron canadensis]